MKTLASRNGNRNGLIRNLREQVASHIRYDVLCGHLAAGAHLREAELAERFGVSRGPVRDALLQLAQEGWLVLQPHCGARVAPPISQSLRPLIQSLRNAVEEHALRVAFPTLSAADFAVWQEILEKMRRACASGDLPAIAEQDFALHQALVERAEPELRDLWLPLMARLRFAYFENNNNLMEIYEKHRRVIDSFHGDVETAVRALFGSNIRDRERRR